MTSTTEMRESGRQVVGSGATSNSTSTSPDSAARSSRIRPSSARRRSTAGAEDRQRVRRRVGGRELGRARGDLDRLAEALVALLGGVALGDEALGLAGLLEHAPALGQGGLGLGPPVARAGQRVAVALELREGRLALLDRGLGLVDRLLGDLEPARVLVAPGVRSWSALSSFLRARLVPRSAPLIEAWSRSRSAPSSRDRSLSSWWRTDAVERKKPSVGMPVSSAMTWSASAGSVMDWPS